MSDNQAPLRDTLEEMLLQLRLLLGSSDRSVLCFRLSLKIEPGDGSPRLASYQKELAGTLKAEIPLGLPRSC